MVAIGKKTWPTGRVGAWKKDNISVQAEEPGETFLWSISQMCMLVKYYRPIGKRWIPDSRDIPGI